MPELPRDLPCFGICSGDINPSNFHIDTDTGVYLFDFDQCGYGWRAFEIGKFFASVLNYTHRDQLMNAFVAGYTAVRKLSEEEERAINPFTRVALIWVMAIHVYNVDLIGYQYLDRAFWKRNLDRLHEAATEPFIRS